MRANLTDRFELLRQVGEGGFGVVYEAHDKLTGGAAAVKVLHLIDDRVEARFEREAWLLSTLRHPSIVGYLAHGRTAEGQAYLAMEWLEGHTLEARLESGPLSIEDALAFASCVALGLEHAQRAGIVHRDLKPANLFLLAGASTDVRILDFGLARRMDDAQALTRTGAVVGTPHYMSPEQARGERMLESASDVFSLGSVLYECLTGSRPFDTGHALATLMMICIEEPTPARALRPDIPPALERLVHGMLAKQTSARPNLDFIARELARVAGGVREPFTTETRSILLEPPTSTRIGLTPRTEQRVLSAVFLGQIAASVELDQKLRDALARFDARGERLLDGSRILRFDGHITAGEQALAAARCALVLRPLIDAKIVVCTGRALIEHRLPLGDLIERGARLLGHALAGQVELDDVSAALLDARFEVDELGARRILVRERIGGEAPRTLLGQVTPFVGRERELARLEGICSEATEDSAARAVLVMAPAGAGKSRLRYELVQRLETTQAGFTLLFGVGDSMHAATPFGVLTPALHTWAELGSLDSQPLKRDKLLSRVKSVLSEERAQGVAPFLGEMIGVPFADEANPALRAARGDPHLMSDWLLSSFLEWLEGLSNAGPVAMLVEDLHWADPPSVRFLDAALSVLSLRPFVILAFARPEVREAFPALWSERNLFEMRLPKLGAKACERLLQAIGTDLSVSTQGWLIERADGNPFFLEELVRSSRLSPADRALLPDTIVGIIQTRLDALGEGPKLLVRAASIFGQAFRADAVEGLLGHHAGTFDLSGWLRALTEREIVFARQESAQREYVFRHALIRDAAYALLSDDERRLGHRLAAEWLESQTPLEATLLAEHFERGQVLDRAAVWYGAAATDALEASSLSDVVHSGERAVACGASGALLGDVAALVAEALSYGGDDRAAERWAVIARTNTGVATSSWWRASQVLGIGYLRLGSPELAAEVCEEMLRCASSGELTPDAVIALAIVAGGAELFALGGVGARMLALLPQTWSDRLSERAQGHVYGARAYGALASAPGRALAHLRNAAAAFRRAGSARDLSQTLGNLAWLLYEAGALDEAEGYLVEAVHLSRKLALGVDVAQSQQTLGMIFFARGQLVQAELSLRESLGAYAQNHAGRDEALASSYLSLIVLTRGDVEEAATLAARAYELSESHHGARALALAMLAKLELTRGHPNEALDAAQRAMDSHRQSGLIEHVSLLCCVHVESLLACNRLAEARTALMEARDWVLATAATYDVASERQAFLTNVRNNQRILALATQWLGPTE